MSRDLRWIGRTDGDMKKKSNFDVYTGGAWVDLSVDGGALPGEISAGNDTVYYDVNAIIAPSANASPPTFTNHLVVRADYPFTVFSPGAPQKYASWKMYKSTTAPAALPPIFTGPVDLYCALGWTPGPGYMSVTWNVWEAVSLSLGPNGGTINLKKNLGTGISGVGGVTVNANCVLMRRG